MADSINWCDLKKNAKHIGEVSTSRADGSPTGAEILTSTNEVTGDVRDTLDGKLKKFDDFLDDQGLRFDNIANSYGLDFSLGLFAPGVEVINYNQVLQYGNTYVRLSGQSLPYEITGATPDADPATWITIFDNSALHQVAIANNVKFNQVAVLSTTTAPVVDIYYFWDFSNNVTYRAPSPVNGVVQSVGVPMNDTVDIVVDGNTIRLISSALARLRDEGDVLGWGGDFYTAMTEALQTEDVINLKNREYTLAAGEYIIIDRPVTIITDGSTINTTSWGYPAVEFRNSDIMILGKINFKYNGSRTAVINTDTLGYGWDSGNWKDYGSAILMNNNGYTVDNCYIQNMHAFGFINACWYQGNDTRIDVLDCDTTDMGATGGGDSGCSIGKITHKNITGSQGHEGHALYLVSPAGEAIDVGSISVIDSPTGASPLKLHGHKNFTVGSVNGVNLGAIANFRDGAQGSIGAVNVTCNSPALYSGISYYLLTYGMGTNVSIGTLDITTSHDFSIANTVLQSTESAFLEIDNLIVNGTTASSNQPKIALITSNGSVKINNSNIKFLSSTCDNYMFDLLNYEDVSILTPRIETNGSKANVLRNTYEAGQNYRLTIDPNLVIHGMDETSIIGTANQSLYVTYLGSPAEPSPVTGAFPIVTHTNFASISQASVVSLTNLRRGSVGQIITLFNSDGNTNIVNNSGPGTDGNIITKTGAYIDRGDWTMAMFQRIGLNMYQI